MLTPRLSANAFTRAWSSSLMTITNGLVRLSGANGLRAVTGLFLSSAHSLLGQAQLPTSICGEGPELSVAVVGRRLIPACYPDVMGFV